MRDGEALVVSFRNMAIEMAGKNQPFETLKDQLLDLIQSTPSIRSEVFEYAATCMTKEVYRYVRDHIAIKEVPGTPLDPTDGHGQSDEQDTTSRGRGSQYGNTLTAGLRLSIYDFRIPVVHVKLGDATVEELGIVRDYYAVIVDSSTAKRDVWDRLYGKLKRSNKLNLRAAFNEAAIKKIIGDVRLNP